METSSAIPFWLQVLLTLLGLVAAVASAVAAWKAASVATKAFDWQKESAAPRVRFRLGRSEHQPSHWHLMAENFGPADAFDLIVRVRQVVGKLADPHTGEPAVPQEFRIAHLPALSDTLVEMYMFFGDDTEASSEKAGVEIKAAYSDSAGESRAVEVSIVRSPSVLGWTHWKSLKNAFGSDLSESLGGIERAVRSLAQKN